MSMDQELPILALIGAAVLGIIATLVIMRRQRVDEAHASEEAQFAVSTEGMKRCPHCGIGNLVTDSTCASCGKSLP